MPLPTQPIYCIGNEVGGQGLDKFDIMNEAFGNSSFDAGNNIAFGDVSDLDATIDFGNVPWFNSTDYGNPGLYAMTNYGNDVAPTSSNMNGNYDPVCCMEETIIDSYSSSYICWVFWT